MSNIFDQLSGVQPDSVLCVGEGFSTEEIKNKIMENGRSLAASSVQKIESWVKTTFFRTSDLLWLNSSQKEEIMSEFFRKKSSDYPLLKEKQNETDFDEKLHHSIESCRSTVDAQDEFEFLCSFIQQENRKNLYQEVFQLSKDFESYLLEQKWIDLSLAYKILAEDDDYFHSAEIQKKIFVYHQSKLTKLEQQFWERIGQVSSIEWCAPLYRAQKWMQERDQENKKVVETWSSQTFDDSFECLAQKIAEWVKSGVPEKDISILLTDDSDHRSAFEQFSKQHGIQLFQYRSPLALREDSSLSLYFSVLEGWQENLPRKVLENYFYFKGYRYSELPFLYQAAKQYWFSILDHRSEEVFEDLKKIKPYYFSKLNFEQFKNFCFLVSGDLFPKSKYKIYTMLIQRTFENWEKDRKIFKPHHEKYFSQWLKQFKKRLYTLHPLDFQPLYDEQGVQVYRFHQPPFLQKISKLICIGFHPDLFQKRSPANYWILEHEKEKIFSHYPVITKDDVRLSRLSSFLEWVENSEEVYFSHYDRDWKGKEQKSFESLSELVEEVFQVQVKTLNFSPVKKWEKSYEPYFEPLSEIKFSEHEIPKKISVSHFDSYSKCPYFGFAYASMKVDEPIFPALDLDPRNRGSLLHELVQKVVQKIDQDWNCFSDERSVYEWVSLELSEKNLPYLEKDHLFENSILFESQCKKIAQILFSFFLKEIEYRKQIKRKTFYLDQEKLSTSFEHEGRELFFSGRPDRVDLLETQEGQRLVTIDYKTSSSGVAKAPQILEQGYALQLPLYAKMLYEKHRLYHVALQYITLGKDSKRSEGVFLKKVTGKKSETHEKVLTTTSRNSSVVNLDESELLEKIDHWVSVESLRWLSGDFSPKPKNDQDCTRCRLKESCGQSRNHLHWLSQEDQGADDAES